MEPYAVVETGGKQYLVKGGDTLKVEKIETPKGETVELRTVYAISDGTKLEIGRPAVAGAKVTCSVVDHVLGDKVVSYKKKRRKGYERKVGHRQHLTVLKVSAVGRD